MHQHIAEHHYPSTLFPFPKTNTIYSLLVMRLHITTYLPLHPFCHFQYKHWEFSHTPDQKQLLFDTLPPIHHDRYL